MLDESICHFRVVRSIIDGKTLIANTADPDQTPHYVVFDLGLHCLPKILGKNMVRSPLCLPMTLLQVSR